MNINKEYQFRKIKNYLKNNNTLTLIVNCSRIEFRSWVKSEQIVKQHGLEYYTVTSNRLLQMIKNSTYKNFSQILSSTILLTKNQSIKQIVLFLKSINNLEIFILPLVIRVNNKMHTSKELKDLKLFNFKQNIKNLNTKLILFSRLNKKF